MKPEQFGRYKVVGSLGVGAMGCVYEGFDPHIERRVAIKTIRLEQLTPEMEVEFEARFRSEVRAAGRLHHPNIVALHDAGRDEGVAYTVMEFVEGQDLKRHLDGGAIYSVEAALKLVQQLLAALGAAHAQGVIHRDVKPANVMLTAGGQVKLTDFGVARVLDSGDATRTRGMIVGTVKYASPEQLSGLPLDGRSDLFSVGVLLYRLLAHRHPFDGPNELAIMQKVLHDEPPAPSSLNPSVPVGLDAVVLKAMAKSPDGRPRTAAEFSGELQAFMPGTPYVDATQPGLTTTTSTSTSTATRTSPSATRTLPLGDETVLVGAPAPTRTEVLASAAAGKRSGTRKWLAAAAAGIGVVAVGIYAFTPRSGNVPPVVVAPLQPVPASQPVVASAPALSPPAAPAPVVEAAASQAVVPPLPATSAAARAASVAPRAASTVVAQKKPIPPPVASLDGRWSGHYLCSELLIRSTAKNRGSFKANIVLQVNGKVISWTRRGDNTLETMSGHIAPDGRWSAEGIGQNTVRRDNWLTVAKGVYNRKVTPPRFDGDLQILSPDRATLFRKCTLTAVRDPA